MVKETPYGGWKRNLLIRGARTELVVTLDVGPRVIRYAGHDGENVFAEIPEQMGGTREQDWMIRGGHRFWTAPEGPHAYELDNVPVNWNPRGENSVEIVLAPSTAFGFQKTLGLELRDDEVVRVSHRLTNVRDQPLEMTPWALSVMAHGGMAVIPQPFLDLHPSEFPTGRLTQDEDFLPNRELVLWPFTNLTDGRYAFGENFLRVTSHLKLPATKLGLKLSSGWIAYQNRGDVFAKHVSYDPAAPYPDRGVNFELFTNPAILELESLAPSVPLAPGETREHVEYWTLHGSTADLRDEKSAQAFFQALPTV